MELLRLKGDMTFVGQCPDMLRYTDALARAVREVLALRPGIISPASLKNRGEEESLTTVDDPQKYNDEVLLTGTISSAILSGWI